MPCRKMGGEFTYPKMVPLVLTHSQLHSDILQELRILVEDSDSHLVTGLESLTDYTFQVAAENAAGGRRFLRSEVEKKAKGGGQKGWVSCCWGLVVGSKRSRGGQQPPAKLRKRP